MQIFSIILATNLCFAEKAVYTQEVLAMVIQQLMDQSPLPILLMRTVIQSLAMYPKLLGFVMNIMQRLISKQVEHCLAVIYQQAGKLLSCQCLIVFLWFLCNVSCNSFSPCTMILLLSLVTGVETKECVGRICSLLPENTSQFLPGLVTATSTPVEKCFRSCTRPS